MIGSLSPALLLCVTSFPWTALASGNVDHLPTDLPDTVAPTLVSHLERVPAIPAVARHYQ